MQRAVESRVYMDTVITIEVRGVASDTSVAIERAFRWFAEVEQRCNRFDKDSELSRLCRSHGDATKVSPLLQHSIALAVCIARATEGAFDPSLGGPLHALGFNRNYRTGSTAVPPSTDPKASYRDIKLNADGTITLARPLLLDLGGIAKGIALDLAARDLAAAPWFAINAGGDVISGGVAECESCRVAITSPFEPEGFLSTVDVHGLSACTSGDYERQSGNGHHLLDRGRVSARELRSVTVIAPQAAVADAMATAAFALGPKDGARLLEASGVHGLLVTPAGEEIRAGKFACFEV